jgi:hypothetical protein
MCTGSPRVYFSEAAPIAKAGFSTGPVSVRTPDCAAGRFCAASTSRHVGEAVQLFDAPIRPLSAKLVKNGTLKAYKGFPHGMPTTQADTINPDLLAFLKA